MKRMPASTRKGLSRLRWGIVALLMLLLFAHALAYFVFIGLYMGESFEQWIVELILSSAVLTAFGLLALLLVSYVAGRNGKLNGNAAHTELQKLRAANQRAKSLQAMAATLSATLSFERVMEVALDVCGMTLDDMGIPSRSLVGAVFLYHGDELAPVAARRFVARDYEKRVSGDRGIIGKAIKDAEPAFTYKPSQDSELRNFIAFQNCNSVVCLPLRAGFQIYGAMVLGAEADVAFNEDHIELFSSVADQAVVALQNAQLYQKLEAEKQRIIEADEEARKELARDLHDGPTQSVAAIAMRINFIRSLMTKDPRQAYQELKKVEDLAKQTSKEIRSMLFALRPLVLENKGLGAAVEMAMEKIRETDGLNMRLVGGDYGDLLNESAQGTAFYIIEEALGNARKYSKASLIEVRFWQEDGLFVARVQDDGVGFDTAAVNADYSSRGSLGMVNMRERAERLDGSLKVESAPGQGTSITLVVPLDKHGREVKRSARQNK